MADLDNISPTSPTRPTPPTRGRTAQGAQQQNTATGQGDGNQNTSFGDNFSNFRQKGQKYGLNALSYLKNAEVVLPFGVLLILAMLLVPMPTFLMDISLAFSITISVIVLMSVIFVSKPIELTSFPTILLLAALLRLGLNVASTRLILSNGHEGTDAAGAVIEAFGSFVAGGSYVIGLIVFAILVIINFIVITKGAGRIAEVSARFTLDAIPGRQMAIDADLTAGFIDEATAKQRRADLQTESSFYGAMDGASKFVRGDAIAGLLITFINVIGGIIIGIVQRDMPLGEAAQVYTLLTIGDGLVSQIPALIVSVGAGILVTKSGMDDHTEKTLARQMSANPMVFIIAAFLLLLMALIPGLPAQPFLIMFVLAAGIAAYLVYRKQIEAKEAIHQVETANQEEQAERLNPENVNAIKQVPPLMMLRIELGYALLPMIKQQDDEGGLGAQISGLRKQIADRMGIIIPKVHIQDNTNLGHFEYKIFFKETEVGGGELRIDRLLCISQGNPNERMSIKGEKTIEPAFGLPALWISENQREDAQFQGYTVIESPIVLITHLSEIINQNLPELLTYANVQQLLNDLPQDYQNVVKDLIPSSINISMLQKILQKLLMERISIRDLPLILEVSADAAQTRKSVSQIAEIVRSYLARQICSSIATDDGVIHILTLSPEWDQIITESLSQEQSGDLTLNLAPTRVRDFMHRLEQAYNQGVANGKNPVLVVSALLRPYVREMTMGRIPQLPILSVHEMHKSSKWETMGQI